MFRQHKGYKYSFDGLVLNEEKKDSDYLYTHRSRFEFSGSRVVHGNDLIEKRSIRREVRRILDTLRYHFMRAVGEDYSLKTRRSFELLHGGFDVRERGQRIIRLEHSRSLFVSWNDVGFRKSMV